MPFIYFNSLSNPILANCFFFSSSSICCWYYFYFGFSIRRLDNRAIFIYSWLKFSIGIESSSGDNSPNSCIASKEDPPLLIRYTIFKNSKRLIFPLFKGRASVMKSSNVIPRSLLLFFMAKRNNVNFADILFAILINIISLILTIISLIKDTHIKLPPSFFIASIAFRLFNFSFFVKWRIL